jgi:hypothetical protein
LWSSLSRLALSGLAALRCSFSYRLPSRWRIQSLRSMCRATATTISGGTLDSCASGATCDFSGMFQVDVTDGTVETSGFDITFPGLPDFDNLVLLGPTITGFSIQADNSSSDALTLDFTQHQPGFAGGLHRWHDCRQHRGKPIVYDFLQRFQWQHHAHTRTYPNHPRSCLWPVASAGCCLAWHGDWGRKADPPASSAKSLSPSTSARISRPSPVRLRLAIRCRAANGRFRGYRSLISTRAECCLSKPVRFPDPHEPTCHSRKRLRRRHLQRSDRKATWHVSPCPAKE